MNTANQSRGKFARLCVEIDLNKPLDAKYEVNGSVTLKMHAQPRKINLPWRKTTSSNQQPPKRHEDTTEGTAIDKGKKVISEPQEFGSWMVVQKQKRTKRQSFAKDDSGAKCKSDREVVENVGERTRYEEDTHQANKTFLSGSDMRRIKALNGPHLSDLTLENPTLITQGNPTETHTTHNVITHGPQNIPTTNPGPNPVVTVLTPPELHLAHPTSKSQARNNDPTSHPPQPNNILHSPIPSPSQHIISGGTIVLETPPEDMDIVVNVEPPDPGDHFLIRYEMEESMAQGTQAIMAL
ncbi:hypothetical protein PIB30_068531 [Stylosanthes scabra]|uniref:Uncharacterized protein n=1 Tax=Stylosanthes scabra TaxID=79078 RepID=A0ABU6ULR7_9FABA|nr:hypothetical protein [Stylosanthes scabra]